MALDWKFHGCWAAAALVVLTVSVLAWPVAAVLAGVIALAVLLRFRGARGSVMGVLTGAGLFAFGVAFVHRHNGNLCWDTGSEAGCDQTLDWHVWVPMGLVLVAAG